MEQKKRPRPKHDPKTRAKAEEIAARSGLPMPMALLVARGKLTVNDALKRLMERERVERLAQQHGMELSLAHAVVQGKTSLDAAILVTQLRTCPEWNPERSVLVELAQSGGAATFFAFGEPPYRARVDKVLKYDVVLHPEPDGAAGDDAAGGEAPEPRTVTKHFLKFVSPEASPEALAPFLGEDPAVAKLALGASVNYRDRFRSKKRILFRHHRDALPTRVVLRDGTQLYGLVGWFGKWEFAFRLLKPAKKLKKKGAGPTIVVFRHAMHVFEPAA